ncbi:MAG: TetR/AcrR family transcriptional regulator [Solirubrobacterales bacterium]
MASGAESTETPKAAPDAKRRSRRRIPATDRRELLLAAALEVFAEHGYHETSLGHIAERAGVSKALIYEHFDSKAELHRALLERNRDELLGRVFEAIEGLETPEERLRAGHDAFLGFVEERRDAWRMLFLNPGDPEAIQTVERLQEQVRTITAQLVAEHAPRESPIAGESVEVAAEMIAEQLVGSIRALAAWWDRHRNVPRAEILEALMDFAWLGLERVAAGERWTQPSAG